RWRQAVEPPLGIKGLIDLEAIDANTIKLTAPYLGIQSFAEQHRDTELLRNTFVRSMDSVVDTLLPWRSAAESLLNGLYTDYTDPFRNSRFLELAHAFDGSDIESDEDEADATTSHGRLIVPVTREIILVSA